MDHDQRERLAEHYAGLDRNELVRQGRDHLGRDLRPRIRRTHRWLRVALWTLVIVALVGLGVGAIWLLLQARERGADMAEQRELRMRQYLPEGE